MILPTVGNVKGDSLSLVEEKNSLESEKSVLCEMVILFGI